MPSLSSISKLFVKDDSLDGEKKWKGDIMLHERNECRRSDFSRNGETTAL